MSASPNHSPNNLNSESLTPFEIKASGPGQFICQGDLNAHVPGHAWDAVFKSAKGQPPSGQTAAGQAPSGQATTGQAGKGQMAIDISTIKSLDLNGAAQLLWLKNRLKRKGVTLAISEPPKHLAAIWTLALNTLGPPAELPVQPSFFEKMGRLHSNFWADFLALTAFLGELLSHLVEIIFRPWRLRWGSTLFLVEQAVVNALPVTALVSFLVGLILAFQSAMFMRLFGVDIFVADLVGLALIRELGTLLTAIVLTGRSGSAFSAELGAMKANQEIDAFVTMGLSPSRDLVLPRVMALTLATPLLTVLADFAGLIGGNVVMVTLGHPVSVFWTELSGHVDMSDFATGLFKSFVFGFTVATIGCQRGLAAASGPTAVGQATTLGVVTNIIVLAVLDSLFAVLFYILNW